MQIFVYNLNHSHFQIIKEKLSKTFFLNFLYFTLGTTGNSNTIGIELLELKIVFDVNFFLQKDIFFFIKYKFYRLTKSENDFKHIQPYRYVVKLVLKC